MRWLPGLSLLVLPCLGIGACGDGARDVAATSAGGHGETSVRVGGSDDVYPIARTLAREFEKVSAPCDVVFSPPAHTRGGAAAVAERQIDIGLVSRPLNPDEKVRQLTHLHLAEDIVVFAVHRDVGLRALTSQQVLQIYSGTITNWQQVGGQDLPIVVLDWAEHTSLKIVMRQRLMGEEFQVTTAATVIHRSDDMVTSLGFSAGAIGYMSLGNAMREAPAAAVLAVDGVEPRPANLWTSGYPYTRPFGLMVGPKPSEAAMRFVRFVYSEAGRRILEAHGFVPVTMDLVIAALPEQDLLAQEQRYAPLIEYLSNTLGMQTTVQLRLLPSYGDVIQELATGRVNAAFLGSTAFVLAAAQVGVTPVVRPEKDGVSQYRGLIVTRRDSGITHWRQLEGKRFGMVDRGTTAGYVFPLLFLRSRGVDDPERFLGEIVFTGSHDLLFEKVHNGELDAGAAKDLMLFEVAKDRPQILDELHILATSQPVPNNVFVLNGSLSFPCLRCHSLVPQARGDGAIGPPRRPQEVQQLLTRLLLELHESDDGRQVLEALGADRFVPTTNDDLQAVDRMVRAAGFDPATFRP